MFIRTCTCGACASLGGLARRAAKAGGLRRAAAVRSRAKDVTLGETAVWTVENVVYGAALESYDTDPECLLDTLDMRFESAEHEAVCEAARPDSQVFPDDWNLATAAASTDSGIVPSVFIDNVEYVFPQVPQTRSVLGLKRTESTKKTKSKVKTSSSSNKENAVPRLRQPKDEKKRRQAAFLSRMALAGMSREAMNEWLRLADEGKVAV